MDAALLEIFNTLYGVVRDRPELSLTAFVLMLYLLERSERKAMTSKNFELTEKMADQNKDTNELLGQIKFLLELLTKGRN